MSFEVWKPIRENAKVNAEVALRSAQAVGTIPGSALSLADDYNALLLDNFKEIAAFLDTYDLWPKIKVNSLATIWLQIKNQNNNRALGGKLTGILAKFSAIELLTAKIDQIFGEELSYVEKAEHAFAFLNRKLFLIEDYRDRWLKAFSDQSEPILEKLGGLHLFECGIWAFKAGGPREETDLILDQNIKDSNEEKIPLVMTEWKKAKDLGDAEIKITEAITQCRLYSGGVARPLQLKDHRFVVIVSLKPIDCARTIDDSGKRYLVRNIAVQRPNPSREARS